MMLVACGLSVSGQLAGEGDAPPGTQSATDASGLPGDPTRDAAGGDAVADSGPPPPPCLSDACAAGMPPAGFAPILLGTTADACPSGFTTADLLESPVAAADACACGTCVMTGTNCGAGDLPTAYDQGGGACGSTGATLSTNNGACSNSNGTFGQNTRIDAPAAVPGTCTAPSTGVKAKVSSTPHRVCELAPGSCADRLCTPPGSLRACMMHEGDVACPAEATEKHLVGPDFTIACGACSCTTSATCGGKTEFWSANGCGGAPSKTFTAGVCASAGGASYSSYKWTGMVATQTCTDLTPPAATVSLTQTKTICCP